MFVLNVNNGQEIVTQADYIMNAQNQVSAVTNFNGHVGYLIDSTNKYIYIMTTMTAAPWFTIKRHTYNAGVVGSGVTMTLSGFGTFTTQPTFYGLQGSKDGNFHLYCGNAGGSGSFATLTIYPITISGTTVTLGAANTLPVVASYTIRNIFVKGAVIYAFYGLTAGPNTMDVTRKYSGSWSTLTGGALLTSIGAFTDASGTISGQTRMPTGSSYQYFQYYNSSAGGARFDTSTDTWEADTRLISASMVADASGHLIAPGVIILSDDSTIIGPASAIGSALYPSDIVNGLLYNANSSGILAFSGAVIGANRRIRRIFGSTANSTIIMLYSMDAGVTWHSLPYITTLISSNYNLNYSGDIICIVAYNNVSQVITAEIV